MNMTDQDLAAIIQLDVDEPATAAELDRLLTALRAELAEAQVLHDAIAAGITEPSWRDSREVEHQRLAARSDLLLLERGVGRLAGVADHRLVARMGRPGINRLRELDAKLSALRDQLREQREWPRPFRYTGRPGKHRIDGVYLDPGDVVELSARQAAAWSDRFEEVEEVTA